MSQATPTGRDKSSVIFLLGELTGIIEKLHPDDIRHVLDTTPDLHPGYRRLIECTLTYRESVARVMAGEDAAFRRREEGGDGH